MFIRAAVNYAWYADPLGPGHGPYTGRGADGTGGTFGAGWEFHHTGPFGLYAEACADYRTTGYRYNEGQRSFPFPPAFLADGLDEGRRSMHVAQVQAPLFVVYRGFPGLRLQMGVGTSKLIFAQERWHGTRLSNGGTQALDMTEDRTSMIAPWEFSGIAGVLVEGPRGWHVELRYLNGFTNLDRGEDSSPSYTSGVQVGLVYSPKVAAQP